VYSILEVLLHHSIYLPLMIELQQTSLSRLSVKILSLFLKKRMLFDMIIFKEVFSSSLLLIATLVYYMHHRKLDATKRVDSIRSKMSTFVINFKLLAAINLA